MNSASVKAAASAACQAAHQWLAGLQENGEQVAWQHLAEAEMSLDAHSAQAVAQACMALEKASLLRLDGAAFTRALLLHRRCIESLASSSEALWLEAAELWLAFWQERHGSEWAERAALLERQAAKKQDAALVIECAVLRSMAALDMLDMQEATALARRASRMARTEALPQSEYLAHWNLARLRRVSGKPHFSTHILLALARLTPPAWHSWLDWELALSGVPSTFVDEVTAGDGIRQVVAHAAAGKRPQFDAASEEMSQHVEVWPAWRADWSALKSCLDPQSDGEAMPSACAAWCQGEEASVPRGLQGIYRQPAAEKEANTTACVWITQGGSRRFLRPGVKLVGSESVRQLELTEGGARIETAIAALGLASPYALREEDFFGLVYGFPFKHELHHGALDVLVHRTRLSLLGVATLERDAGHLMLTCEQPFLVNDPRCTLSTAAYVVQILATRGGATAKQAALDLGMPLRTVQAALQELVAEGICAPARQGRMVAYHVEDTTFSEPTVHS